MGCAGTVHFGLGWAFRLGCDFCQAVGLSCCPTFGFAFRPGRCVGGSVADDYAGAARGELSA
ncbi:hypothetical protein GCM10010435_22160 [Winogradskya consettensis]|uniref:Uncharacterized protein n=1 Tax=Winogradskya consettensis TaxID=113560 RepID=A0A919VZF2_9ACTN|nr:hypothetical protein Aco04nite_94870 [Actinoplanes consettensis]